VIRRPLTPRFWIRFSTLVAVISVSLSLAHLTWRLTGWDDGRSRIETPDRLPPVGGDGGLASILALAPFGGGTSVGASGLPPTSLGLVLKGVILAASPEASTALIAVGEAAPRNFSIGEAPIGSAVIEGIELDVVVLNVGGRREALTFPRLVGTSSAAAPAAPGATPAVASPPSPEAAAALAAASPIATALAASGGGGAPAGQGARPPVAAPANPAAALQPAGVSASSDGYRLGPGAAAQLLRAGLRPGDLIRSLNGRPVGDLASDQQLFERAAAAGSARVEIVRDGRTLTLTFPLR
jgi:general secretion pathway protein C